MRSVRATTYAVVGAAVLAALAPTAAGAGTRHLDLQRVDGQRIEGACRPSAATVGTKTLRTQAGKRLGRARITIETVGDTTTVCGVVAVRKAFRTRSTLVTLDLREVSADGEDLGRARAIERATHLSPPTMVSSFVPTGSTFVFTAKIDIGATAKGTTRYLVP